MEGIGCRMGERWPSVLVEMDVKGDVEVETGTVENSTTFVHQPSN